MTVGRLDVHALGAGDVFTVRTRFGDLDLSAHPEPDLDYQALRSRAERFELQGSAVGVASLDLIAMKRAAGRPKDLLMLEHLGALREEIDRRG